MSIPSSSPLPPIRTKASCFSFMSLPHLASLIIIINFFFFLLVKFFSLLLIRGNSISTRDVKLTIKDNKQDTEDCHFENEDHFVADVLSREEGSFFFYSENAGDDTRLIKEGRDTEYEQHYLLEGDINTVASDSLYDSPDEYIAEQELGEVHYNFVSFASLPSPSPITLTHKNLTFDDLSAYAKDFDNNGQVTDFAERGNIFVVKQSHLDSKRVGIEDVSDDEENTIGGSLSCESTPKSSMDWRSSTIFQDSESEYPFTSSSRRSSSNWETFALFRKYEEEMMFFDRISAHKLTETESFRSIHVQTRSVSRKMVYKLMMKHKSVCRDAYRDLESAYVAQVCLAWEALNWNYNNFQQKIVFRDREAPWCPAGIAQRFQQFQVLLQRFIENEPYEQGRRPEVFARIRNTSPKLLQVPELKDSEEDESKEVDVISSDEFLVILEDAIQTFMNFLKTDKKNTCQMIRAFIPRRSSTAHKNQLILLRKTNKKKKTRLKDIARSRRCPRNRKLKGEQEAMEITMSLIDMKVVSRVLRMPDISPEQLRWCQEKMAKVRVSNGRTQRDPSPLFFPCGMERTCKNHLY